MKINYLIKLINSLDQLLLDHQCQLLILKRGAIFYVKNELLKTLPNPHSHLATFSEIWNCYSHRFPTTQSMMQLR